MLSTCRLECCARAPRSTQDGILTLTHLIYLVLALGVIVMQTLQCIQQSICPGSNLSQLHAVCCSMSHQSILPSGKVRKSDQQVHTTKSNCGATHPTVALPLNASPFLYAFPAACVKRQEPNQINHVCRNSSRQEMPVPPLPNSVAQTSPFRFSTIPRHLAPR